MVVLAKSSYPIGSCVHEEAADSGIEDGQQRPPDHSGGEATKQCRRKEGECFNGGVRCKIEQPRRHHCFVHLIIYNRHSKFLI